MGQKFKTLIIGAGNIGAKFDNPSSQLILSHAHAFKKHDGFDLLGFIDKDPRKSTEAAVIWDCNSYSTLGEVFSKTKVDVICIANPDEFHYSTLKEAALYPVKLVFTEKPLTKSEKEGKEILNLFKGLCVPILVNYSRRFVTEFYELKQRISEGLLGNFITGTGYYGKGIVHNGSHMIDLIRFLISDVESFHVLSSFHDFYSDDPSVSCILNLKNRGSIYLHHIDCSKYTIFDLDILFENGRVSITESGLKINYYLSVESADFKGYSFLAKKEEITTSLFKAIYSAADNIYQHLSTGADLLSPASEAYINLNVCQDILNSANNLQKTNAIL